MKAPFALSMILVTLLSSAAVAQDTSITFHLLPKYVGGPTTSTTTLEQPLPIYFTITGLEPNTDYDQAHMGFLQKGTSTVRGSKWTVNGWISPSTQLYYKKSDALGAVTGWAYVRTPSSFFVGIDTTQIRIRVRKTGSAVNVTFDSEPLTSLDISASATGATAGAIIYGFVDSTLYGGKIAFVYGESGTRPLSAWFVLPDRAKWTTDFFTTRMDTLYRRGGYFQLVVPTNTKIAKIEIRDTLNVVAKTWTSTQWTSGAAGSKTEINFALAGVLEKENGNLPRSFLLEQNFPNPFNPATDIQFSMKNRETVHITVYDVLGKEIETLVREELGAGIYTINWNAEGLPSGVYYYRMNAGLFSQTRKMILMK